MCITTCSNAGLVREHQRGEIQVQRQQNFAEDGNTDRSSPAMAEGIEDVAWLKPSTTTRRQKQHGTKFGNMRKRGQAMG